MPISLSGYAQTRKDRICSTSIGTTGTAASFRRGVMSTVVPAMLRTCAIVDAVLRVLVLKECVVPVAGVGLGMQQCVFVITVAQRLTSARDRSSRERLYPSSNVCPDSRPRACLTKVAETPRRRFATWLRHCWSVASSCLRSNDAGHRFLGDVSDPGLRAGRTLPQRSPSSEVGTARRGRVRESSRANPAEVDFLWIRRCRPADPSWTEVSAGHPPWGKGLFEYTFGFA